MPRRALRCLLPATVVALVTFQLAASTVLRTFSDGVRVDELSPNAYVSYGCVPGSANEMIALHFEGVLLDDADCDDVEVAVYKDGLIRDEFNLLDTLCHAEELRSYTATSYSGFFVVVRTHRNFTTGSLTIKFESSAGIFVTNERVVDHIVN